jgi:catechol 2,3-dioxygenase-like lactoylglutathione lyase family enzyme
MKPVKLSITGLQHVGIPVTDLKTSTEFYEKLGFVMVMEAPFKFNNEPGTCIMMKYGDIMMELYQLPERELFGIKNRTDGHIDHIAFDVPDIDDTFATLKDAGYTILEETPTFLKFWRNGCKFFNILGPNGERLEFNQVL